MKLPSRIKFIDNRIKRSFEELETGSNNKKQLYAHLIKAFKNLEKNAFHGIQMPKKLIPKEYLKKYNLNNLWKYNLPNSWRLLYAIEKEEIIVISIIIEWMDHKDYDRKFKY